MRRVVEVAGPVVAAAQLAEHHAALVDDADDVRLRPLAERQLVGGDERCLILTGQFLAERGDLGAHLQRERLPLGGDVVVAMLR